MALLVFQKHFDFPPAVGERANDDHFFHGCITSYPLEAKPGKIFTSFFTTERLGGRIVLGTGTFALFEILKEVLGLHIFEFFLKGLHFVIRDGFKEFGAFLENGIFDEGINYSLKNFNLINSPLTSPSASTGRCPFFTSTAYYFDYRIVCCV